MKTIIIVLITLTSLIFFSTNSYAGGAIGITPASGIKVLFTDGGRLTHLPIKLDLEINLGESQKHVIGSSVAYDIGLNNSANFVAVAAGYKFYARPYENSFYIGGMADFRFRKNLTLITPEIIIGYQIAFGDVVGMFFESDLGYTIVRSENTTSKNSGFSAGIRTGLKFFIGN